MMAAMDRDEARRRLRDLVPAEDTTPLVFRHPAVEQPLPAGDLGVIITSLRADLGVNFPEPIPTPSHFVGLEEVTPAEAATIADFLRVHFNDFELRQGQSLLHSGDGRETTVADVESHLELVERYRAAQRFFAAVAVSGAPARLD